MIPRFPHFRKLSLKDKNEITEFVKNYPPYSDFNFISLSCYDTRNDALVSKLNGNLVVRFRDYITDNPFFTFLGHNKVKATVDTLMEYARKAGLVPELKLIPEGAIKAYPNIKHQYHIEEDRDNFDYICSINAISQLKGSAYYSKHKMVERFIKRYPGHTIIRFDLGNPVHQSMILDFFYLWEKKKNKKRMQTEHELTALKRLLDQARHFNLTSIGVVHLDHLVGFIIAEIIHDKHSISHFMKVNTDYKGISELILKQKASDLSEKGVSYINFEQDLGIEGLRQAKTLWRPTHYLKKFIIKPL